MSDDRKCKTVSFDLLDAFESELLDHAEASGKFSKYIKRLIQRDKEGWGGSAFVPVIQEQTEDDSEAMASFI